MARLPANIDCESRTVLIDSLCPASPVGGGKRITAQIAHSRERVRKRRYGRRTMLRGQVRDGQGNPVARARVCIQARTDIPGKDFRMIGTARTNPNGGWNYKLRPGVSRHLRIAYRDDTFQVSRSLHLKVHATSSRRVSRKKTRPGRRVRFTGAIPGPHASGRVVVVYGTVPGANRRFLVRRARTDAIGRWHAGYAFTPVPGKTKFIFWAVVPKQNGYPYTQGRSTARYVRVSP